MHSASDNARRLPSGTWLLLPCLFAGCEVKVVKNEYVEPPPAQVEVVRPLQQTIPLYFENNGETEAVSRAEVRARVGGILEQVNFVPGDLEKGYVQEGDLLYQIEPTQYEAARSSAAASLKAAEAQIEVAAAQLEVVKVEVTRAQNDFERYKNLLVRDAATQAQFDEALASKDAALAKQISAEADLATAKAARDKAQAGVEQAELDLSWTRVTAPISGYITKTATKRGNLVSEGSLLTTIVDRSRIYANFNISDREVLKLQKATRDRAAEGQQDARVGYRHMPALLHREIDEGFPFRGQLDYLDEEGVDQSTGTLAARALFENPADLLLPGLFVRVRVPVGELPDALLIPEQALVRDQSGSFVWIVDNENRIQRRGVQPGQRLQGLVVIEQGLKAEDRVATAPARQRMRDGQVVEPVETMLEALSLISPDDLPADPAEVGPPHDDDVDGPDSVQRP